MGLCSLWPIQLWAYIVMGLCSYWPIQLWAYIVVAIDGDGRLSTVEIQELVRALCATDAHVSSMMDEVFPDGIDGSVETAQHICDAEFAGR